MNFTKIHSMALKGGGGGGLRGCCSVYVSVILKVINKFVKKFSVADLKSGSFLGSMDLILDHQTAKQC
jgi:hypothetical protein